ncbi:MAG TPA: acyltransferase [Candidatus Sulfotelmatobacter sp.]|nr:acyltransferase [Candidatus Sulfotelmatobacter sp.]
MGAGTAVWAGAHIRRGAVVGPDCVIGEGVLVDCDVLVGARCKVQNHALLYRGARLGDDVFIGPAACLTNDGHPRASTPELQPKTAADWPNAGIDVADGASVGAHAVIVDGCDVGKWAMVGAGSIVTHGVPAHALVVGSPARRVAWVCRCAARLDGELSCPSCGSRYQPDGAGGLRDGAH